MTGRQSYILGCDFAIHQLTKKGSEFYVVHEGNQYIQVAWKDILEWLEKEYNKQEPTTKNDLAVDCISRKSVITIIQNHWWNCRDIDKLVNELPSVTPQEPFINKPCVSSGVCEHDKQKVLDKVYAEIEELQRDMLYASKVEFKDIYKILDKYKAESEVDNGNDN